jgi:hypothetical protein
MYLLIVDSEFLIGFGFAWYLDSIWIGMFKEIYLDWFVQRDWEK